MPVWIRIQILVKIPVTVPFLFSLAIMNTIKQWTGPPSNYPNMEVRRTLQVPHWYGTVPTIHGTSIQYTWYKKSTANREIVKAYRKNIP